MSIQIGYIDSDGHPRLTIRISGTDPKNFIETDALIDTGFTGFLMFPFAEAVPLGIMPAGTADYELADGSKLTNFVGTGTVTICPPANPPAGMPAPEAPTLMQPETVTGLVVLCGSGALVGMGFLKSLDKYLVVGEVVCLIDTALINEAVKVAATNAAARVTTPNQIPN